MRTRPSSSDTSGLRGAPIRSLIKAGFENYVTNILPMEKTAVQVKSEGMDFRPPVISGLAAGLPSDVRFPFDRESLDDLILGRNFIKKVPDGACRQMLEKNVERLVKGPSGEARLEVIDDVSGVIQLAGYFPEGNILEEYGLEERMVRAMDAGTKLAVAAGIEALRDAGIPLVQQTKVTSTGAILPESWALPEELRAETGVILPPVFPGLTSLVDELTREAASRYGTGAKSRLIEFYSGLISRISDDAERERITSWFVKEFGGLERQRYRRALHIQPGFSLQGDGHGQRAVCPDHQGPRPEHSRGRCLRRYHSGHTSGS